MSAFEIAAILACLALGWFWMDSLKAREIAVSAARDACAGDNVLLLDDTVAISALRLVRNEDGHVQLQRAYEFEYSDTGDNRRKGSVVLVGRRVVLLNVGLREASVTSIHR